MDKTETLADCPFCGGAMMFRKALWPSDGCTDAVIHAEPTDCGMAAFDTGKTDESVITTWNTRTPRPDSALADEGEYDCPNCHGEGEIYRYNASDPASPTVHCENCNGTGRAAGLADKLERLLKWHRWDDARLAHWLRGAGDRILAALRTRKSEALADDAVEQVLAHVAGGGPHEWGYRDPVTGEFIADDWPFRAADALAAFRSTPPEADLRAVDLLREAKGYVEDNHDEGCELHWEFGEQNFEANLPDDYDPDKMRIPHCTCGTNDLLARIDAALKEAKDG